MPTRMSLTPSSALDSVTLAPGAQDLLTTLRPRERPATAWPSGVAKYLVPEIVFGAGVLAEIGHAARRLGAVRPLLVTDAGVTEAGCAGQALSRLVASELSPSTWSAVTPNPKDHEVVAGAEAYLAHGCDVLVAVGGGSAIDAAEAIAVLVSNGGSIFDYEGIDRIPRPIPHWWRRRRRAAPGRTSRSSPSSPTRCGGSRPPSSARRSCPTSR